ncbi:MAG: leucine-rich repeat domain-containing protein [Oscillospiraceae bacterium]|nr:leucine-rich repeat domain-containing protein [Oscillospiraceae bacterium]
MKKNKKFYPALAVCLAMLCNLNLNFVSVSAEGEEISVSDPTNPDSSENPGSSENSGETSATEAPKPEELYRFEINTAGRAEIYDFIPSETYKGAVEIPSQLDGCDVGYIGNAAFMNAAGITEVTIPATVTDIGNSVFLGCTSLKKINVQSGSIYLNSVDGVLYADEGKFLVAYPAAKDGDTYQIPEIVDEIAPGCFGFSQNLKQMTIPAHVVYVDSWCFAYSKIEKVSVASANIDEYAFAYCDKLTGLELQSGVETISDASFSNCPALEHVTLPDTLSTVGQYAFCATGMKEITIPANVNDISYGAFGYDEDSNGNLNPISDFVISGYPGTAGQTYCTEEDPENDYKNDFVFVDLSEVPETESENSKNPENSGDSEQTDEDGADAAVPGDNPEEIPEENLEDIIGVQVKGNQFLRILLATVGGIAIILAIALVIIILKKPKNHKNHEKD